MTGSSISPSVDHAPAPPHRHRRRARVLLAWCALSYIAYAAVVLLHLNLLEQPALLAVALVLLVGLWMGALVQPLTVSIGLLAMIPLFGNHPGGRLMEIINLPLAAAAGGFAWSAARGAVALPSGAIWRAAAFFMASALIALAPAVPSMLVRAVQLNHAPTVLAEALSAPENNPLYAVSSAVGLSLCWAWAAGIAVSAAGTAFWMRALRVLTYTLFAVMAIGILDFHGVISLASTYLLWIDPRRPDVSGFQSIFWNPGWFAWYFVIVFGLALGVLAAARATERAVLSTLLVVCYAYSFANPQRGGLVALHVSLAAAAAMFFLLNRHRPGVRLAVPVAAVVAALAIVIAYTFEFIPHSLGSSLFRLIDRPAEASTSNSVRVQLWTVALAMWRDAPLFGVGEGSFDWRFHDYAPPGSVLHPPVHGDAHNTWLQVLATRGLFGLAALAALIYAVARMLARRWADSASSRPLTLGLTFALLAFLTYSTVQGMFYLQAIQLLFWFLVAATAAGTGGPVSSEARHTPRWLGPAVAALAVVAVVTQTILTAPQYAAAQRTIAREPRGFYPLESEPGERWRWSTGHGTLCLQPREELADIRFMVGDPRPDTYPRHVIVRVDDRVIDRFDVTTGGIISRTIRLPVTSPASLESTSFGECTGTPDDVRLTVETDRRWRPLSIGAGPDPRTLGIAVFEPDYRSPVAAGTPME